jgi:hypothetical protein
VTIEAGVLSIRVEQTGADKVASDLGLLDRQLKEMGKQVNLFQEGLKYTGTRAGSLRELASIEQQLKGAISSTNTSLEQRIVAEKQLAQIHTGSIERNESLAGSLKTLALQYITLQAAMRIGGAVVGEVKSVIDLGDSLHDLSQRTGVSVEDLSTLRLVADKSSASIETVAVGFRNLNRSTEAAITGNKKAITAFADLGISVEDLKGKSPEQVLQMVADGMERVTDQGRKVSDASDLFGRSGEALIPTLHELANGGFGRAADEAERLGVKMTTGFSDKADAFNDDLRTTKGALEGLAIVVADAILPSLTSWSEKLTEILVKLRQVSSTPSGSAFWRGLLSPFFGGPNKDTMAPGSPLDNDPLLARLAKVNPTTSPRSARGNDGESSAADRARERALAKALGADLGDIPLTEGTVTTPTGPTPTVGVDKSGKMKGVKGDPAKMLADFALGSDEKIREELAKKKAFVTGLAQDVAGSIGSAFGDAFTAAFSGDDNFFAALGKSLLKSLGNMIMQLGESMIEYAASVALLAAIPGPWQALGWGAPLTAAAGLGLVALGAGMGALAGKGGKGHGGGGSGGRGASTQPGNSQWSVAFDPDKKGRAVVPGTRSIDNAAMPDVKPMVYIGHLSALHPDDPKWQRNVSDTVYNARRRGVRGG